MKQIRIIVAYDKNRGIGYQQTIPWKLKEDLKRFKELTLGSFVIMGRKTYESIGKALPKRINIVISRNKQFSPQDAFVFDTIEKALDFCSYWSETMQVNIIGGEQIYKESIKFADAIVATEIDGIYSSDTYFPEIKSNGFIETDRSTEKEENGIKFYYVIYSKIFY